LRNARGDTPFPKELAVLETVTEEFGGLFLTTPTRFDDDRGYFSESYNEATLREIGIETHFCQDNHAFSKVPGTLRGLHFQSPPFEQAKLVRCTAGRIVDVAVDIRKRSVTYGKHYMVELSSSERNQLYVPPGFAHGYCTLEPNCEVQYKVSNFYNHASEGGILPTDPSLGIEWPDFDMQISEKDKRLALFAALNSPFQVDD